MRSDSAATLEQVEALARESETGLELLTAEELAWREEIQAEQDAERAYELAQDYRAWLWDGWQPAWAH